MDGRRAALLADIDAWSAAARDLAAILSANIEAVDSGGVALESGVCLAEVISTVSTADRFLRMNVALARFDVARFRLRSSLISAALAEGLSEERLVEVLGVPAELAEQVLEELHSESAKPAP